jgi:hypothetical protein
VIIRYYAEYVAQVVGHFVVLLASPVNIVVLFHVYVSVPLVVEAELVEVGVPEVVGAEAAPGAVYLVDAYAGAAV